MKIQEFVELNTFSTFMVQATARYFVSVSSVEDVKELIKTDTWKNNTHYLLGEGSNTLFVGNYEGLVVKNAIEGLEVISEDERTVTIKVGAGENWHQLVLWSLDQGLWGFENLSLIPGTVGAAPVQNIGAYGVEIKDTILEVLAIDTETSEEKVFSNAQCNFSYRNSIFKEHEGRYIITYVVFKLHKQGHPVTEYDRVQEELDAMNISNPTPSDVAQAIITIRDSKLPRVGELGTAGSFFKNPVVDEQKAQQLLEEFPDMKQFPVEDGVKLSAAWLIDYLGYKGVQEGSVGTYNKHALVLINYGGASGTQVWNFAQKIITHVQQVFGVTLEAEVRIIS